MIAFFFCGLEVNRKIKGWLSEKRINELRWVWRKRHTDIHWSSAEDAYIKWSHSSGKWITPNAMCLVLSLGIFQALENQTNLL